MQERDEATFRADRMRGIGGSDAAAVIGADPWRTPLDLYLEKIGEGPERAETKQMKRGKYLEPVAVDVYATLTGRRVTRVGQQLTHPSYPFMIANLDRNVFRDEEIEGVLVPSDAGVLEVKCPNIRTWSRIKREGLPVYYSVQMQHYLAVTNRSWGAFALFNSDLWELIHFDIERDDVFIQRLYAAEADFWNLHVEPRNPPPLVQVEFNIELPAVEGELIVRQDPDWQDAAQNYREALALKADAENIADAGKARLKELMGKLGAVEGAGLRCYWSQRKGRVTFDKKALEKSRPLDSFDVGMAIAAWEKENGITPSKLVFDLIERLKKCTLDLTKFDKHGEPFEEFRTYPVSMQQEPED